MGYKYSRGLPIATGYNLQSNRPLDEREIVKTFDDLLTIPNTYAGIEVKVEDEQYTPYRFIGGTQSDPSNWVKINEKGDTGPQGIQGPQGIPGAVGPKGDKGDQGVQGIQGPQGTNGIKGDKGDRGPAGIAGPEGPQGPIGPQGPEGPEGAGIQINGSDTVANILLKAGQPGDLWIATDTGTDDFSNPVVVGDGLVWEGTGWLNIGPIRGPKGEGVPTGGTTGQILAKTSGADYDTDWIDVAAGAGISNQYQQNNITFTNTTGDYFGTRTASRTGTLTFDMTGAVRGGIAVCYYTNATLDIPTTLYTLGEFKPNALNKLYFERDSDANVTCNIINDLADLGIQSDITQGKTGKVVQNIIECTQAQYNGITPDADTWYLING